MSIQKIFDRSRLRLHRDRVAKTIENHSFLLELSSIDILERLASMDVASNSILEIGAGTGTLTEKLLANYQNSKIVATDVSRAMLELNPAKHKFLLDEEEIEVARLSSDFDIIVSVLNLHHINDIKKFFGDIRGLLKPNGIFIASLFGAGSLVNLRSFLLNAEIATDSGHSPHIHPFATASDIYRLLQIAGFGFIVTDSQRVDIDYDSPIACMHELRNMGEANNLFHGTRALSRTILHSARSANAFSDHAEIITLTAGLNQKPVFLST